MDAVREGKPDPPGNALTEVMKGIYENLPQARAIIAQLDAMPPEERLRTQRVMEAEAERAATRWDKVNQ
jgi:hypothetical protein